MKLLRTIWNYLQLYIKILPKSSNIIIPIIEKNLFGPIYFFNEIGKNAIIEYNNSENMDIAFIKVERKIEANCFIVK